MRHHLDLACVKLSDTQKMLEETTRKLQKLEESVDVLKKDINFSEEKCDSFVWKIEGFSEVLRKAKSGEKTRIVSSPFYRCGYKCKLSLNPNGCGSGKNTHLSIFLIIMKGEYDASLNWPFHKKMIFTLVDQRENENDRVNFVSSVTTDLLDPRQVKSFKRPVTEENIGWGDPSFISHKLLHERRYIVDDTIFIKFSITLPK